MGNAIMECSQMVRGANHHFEGQLAAVFGVDGYGHCCRSEQLLAPGGRK